MTMISKAAEYLIAKPFNKLSGTKLLQKHANNYKHNKTRYIAGFGVGSIVVKDAVGCYYYVTQSLKNEKIPKEKRKFVAALDLANGVLMNLTQIGMFFTISGKKCQKMMFDKTLGKVFSTDFVKKGVELLNKNKSEAKRLKVIKGLKGKAQNAFNILVPLIASTVLAKRIIVPFIATPTATKIKNDYMDKDVPKTQKADSAKTTDVSNRETTFKNIKASPNSELFNEFLKKL